MVTSSNRRYFMRETVHFSQKADQCLAVLTYGQDFSSTSCRLAVSILSSFLIFAVLDFKVPPTQNMLLQPLIRTTTTLCLQGSLRLRNMFAMWSTSWYLQTSLIKDAVTDFRHTVVVHDNINTLIISTQTPKKQTPTIIILHLTSHHRLPSAYTLLAFFSHFLTLSLRAYAFATTRVETFSSSHALDKHQTPAFSPW